MAKALGFHLLPSTGEFTYDTVAYLAKRATETNLSAINTYYGPGGAKTDYSYALDQLQAAHPECQTVSVVCSWFCDGVTAGSCHVYPSTTYIGGTIKQAAGGVEHWRCSGLTEATSGLMSIPTANGAYIYGGTPSDQSLVRCLQDLKARGFKVVFYPFLLLTASGEPWRGRITFSPDVSSAATAAVNAFLGAAATSEFTRDTTNLTVNYSGSLTDWTYRRMILHYANLCVIAGGVSLFVIGSELRGLETIRGPAWTPAGTLSAGHATWDYPFVAGLVQLANDARSVFDGAGLTKNLSTLANLITYSADWSNWMGYQHSGANGQWPHLDSLYAASNIDVVSLDNYMPLSDWTTSETSLDIQNWNSPPPTSWPVATPAATGLGLSGAPTLLSKPYLKSQIEGGEKFFWYYNDSTNLGSGLDPNGSGLIVSRPEGDRARQTRKQYYAGQQLLANKQMRWWWENPHYAIYDTGSGWVSQGAPTAWQAQSKPLIFLEYGVPTIDKGTNQPNVFYATASTESLTPFWSIWNALPGGGSLPQRDETLAELALAAIYEYWNTDGRNQTSIGGVPLLLTSLCCQWTWDARPWPTFPARSDIWGDAGQWPYGDWANGRGPATAPVAPSPDPTPGSFASFPTLSTLGWSLIARPRMASAIAERVSGRSSRAQRRAYALYEFELVYDLLRADSHAELQQIAGFFASQSGAALPFWFLPPNFGAVLAGPLGVGDGSTTSFPLQRAMGAYTEPVQATSGVTDVYLNGVAQVGGWSVTLGYAPSIVFAAAPAAGVGVSADFQALWLCRFAEDVADLENFMALLWKFGTCKLQATRP